MTGAAPLGQSVGPFIKSSGSATDLSKDERTRMYTYTRHCTVLIQSNGKKLPDLNCFCKDNICMAN